MCTAAYGSRCAKTQHAKQWRELTWPALSTLGCMQHAPRQQVAVEPASRYPPLRLRPVLMCAGDCATPVSAPRQPIRPSAAATGAWCSRAGAAHKSVGGSVAGAAVWHSSDRAAAAAGIRCTDTRYADELFVHQQPGSHFLISSPLLCPDGCFNAQAIATMSWTGSRLSHSNMLYMCRSACSPSVHAPC